MTSASAPGKLILCGEHAVVYGQPAIALPLPDIRAHALVEDAPSGTGLRIVLPDIGEEHTFAADSSEIPAHPLAMLVRRTLEHAQASPADLEVTLRSAIPIASGMGSGAALGAALVKALAAHLGATLSPATVAQIVYEAERFYHGTPSGIDNTVVSYEQAIWFVRNAAAPPTIVSIAIGRSCTLVVGDTGVRAPTHVTVGGVRERWQREPERYEAHFATIGRLAQAVRAQLADGDLAAVGHSLNQNQAVLEEIGVSSPELERLVGAARAAGALGAKLSGGGGGGIMVALVADQQREAVAQALLAAGATQIMHTSVAASALLS